MRKPFIRKHALHAIACAGMSSLLLASCGGGGEASAPQTTQAAASGSTAAAASVQSTQTVDAGTGTAAAMAGTTTTTSSSTATSPAGSTSSSNTASSSTVASNTTAASSTPRVIEYYGDSTVWGYTPFTGQQVAVPAPAAFAAALPAAGNYDVHNEGVSGSTACGLLNGSDGKHPAWSTQMANSPASVVIMNFAINDEWQEDLGTYQSCLTQLARQAKNRGKKVVFETPNPTRDSGPSGLDVYVNAMKSVAAQEQLPVIDQYQYLTTYLNGQSPLTICPDGLHPTAEVYVMKGKYAAGVFGTLGI